MRNIIVTWIVIRSLFWLMENLFVWSVILILYFGSQYCVEMIIYCYVYTLDKSFRALSNLNMGYEGFSSIPSPFELDSTFPEELVLYSRTFLYIVLYLSEGFCLPLSFELFSFSILTKFKRSFDTLDSTFS